MLAGVAAGPTPHIDACGQQQVGLRMVGADFGMPTWAAYPPVRSAPGIAARAAAPALLRPRGALRGTAPPTLVSGRPAATACARPTFSTAHFDVDRGARADGVHGGGLRRNLIDLPLRIKASKDDVDKNLRWLLPFAHKHVSERAMLPGGGGVPCPTVTTAALFLILYRIINPVLTLVLRRVRDDLRHGKAGAAGDKSFNAGGNSAWDLRHDASLLTDMRRPYRRATAVVHDRRCKSLLRRDHPPSATPETG